MAERGPSENLQCENYQTLNVDAIPLDLFDQSLLLDTIVQGTHQSCGGVDIFFEKRPYGYALNRESFIHTL